MASIYDYELINLDLKDSKKIRLTACKNDNIILHFSILDYYLPINIEAYSIKFTALKPDNTVYSQTENITKSGNEVTINCSSQLTATGGHTVCQLRLWNPLDYTQKSSYEIIIDVKNGVLDVDRSVSQSLIDTLDHLDTSIDEAIELSTNFDEAIEEASEMNETLNNTFSTATNTIKPALDSSVSSAIYSKIELDSVNTMAQALKDEILGLAPSINNHIDDEDIHVTKSEKDNWNSRWAMIEQILNLVDILIANSPILTETGDTIVTEDGSILTV